jgi:hypothetical protein
VTTLDLADRIAVAVLGRPDDGAAAVLDVLHETSTIFARLGSCDRGATTYHAMDEPDPAGAPLAGALRRPIDSPSQGPPDAPACVITRRVGIPVCLHCGLELPPPATPKRPRRFCPGNRCRSMWHLEQHRKVVMEVNTKLDEIAALVRGLK